MSKLKQLSSPGTVPNQDEGSPYPSRIPPILDGPAAEDCVLASMRQRNIPITRRNYVRMAYGATVPAWGGELESELPEEIQDWTCTEWPWGVTSDEDGD
jgi:hypothetical protein